jgi:hypothetical protein
MGVMNYPSSEGVIKIRLDTSSILRDMELFLKGLRLTPVYDPETQETRIITQDVGSPLANDKGIQSILMTLSQTINSHGVQGNWKSEYFEQFVCEVDKNFTCDLWVNLNRWGISLDDYNVICDAFMNLVQQFASRIIENKERESYGLSMRTNETVLQQPQNRSLLFGGG